MFSNNSIRDRILCFFRKYFKKHVQDTKFIFDINDPVILDLCKKAKTRGKIAGEFGFSVKTLNRRFAEYNLNIPSGLICPSDLRLIYSTLGIPEKLKMGDI
jgi:hypothetical protein